MKISKILAGMSAMAIAATMAISASAESSIAIEGGSSDAWAGGLGSIDGGNDYIDAKTFTKDEAMHVKVDFEYTPTFLDMISEGVLAEDKIYVVCAPVYANGWAKFGASGSEGMTTDYIEMNNLPDGWTKDGDVIKDADGKMPEVFVKEDGFIQVTNTDITSIEFDLSADLVNTLIANATADEESWDGLLFQVGGNFSITNVTVSQDGVKLASQNVATEDSSSVADTSSSSAASSSSSTASSSSSAASSSSKSGSTNNNNTKSNAATSTAASSSTASDDTNAGTGATAGIALAGIALAGAALVVAKKK